MKFQPLLRAAVLTLAAVVAGSAPAAAAGGKGVPVLDYDWSFEGPFGQFDQAQLQRGWQVYSEVCAACHSLRYVHFRDLGIPGGPAFPPEQVEAIAAGFSVGQEDILTGEVTEVPAQAKDAIWGPFEPVTGAYPNLKSAEVTLGAVPPDLSLIIKSRVGYSGIVTQIVEGIGGPEYLYSLLVGYRDEPAGFELPEGSHFNVYYPGHAIKMAAPLSDGAVEYQGENAPEATTEQMAKDVVAFLTWASEPHMESRKQAGFANIVFLSIFAVLLFFSTRKLWKPIKEGKDA